MFAENTDQKFSINCNNYDPGAPLVTISFPEFEYEIKFPDVSHLLLLDQESEGKSHKKVARRTSSVSTATSSYRPASSSIRLLDSATQTDIYQRRTHLPQLSELCTPHSPPFSVPRNHILPDTLTCLLAMTSQVQVLPSAVVQIGRAHV